MFCGLDIRHIFVKLQNKNIVSAYGGFSLVMSSFKAGTIISSTLVTPTFYFFSALGFLSMWLLAPSPIFFPPPPPTSLSLTQGRMAFEKV
jgi:hypothetical protein